MNNDIFLKQAKVVKEFVSLYYKQLNAKELSIQTLYATTAQVLMNGIPQASIEAFLKEIMGNDIHLQADIIDHQVIMTDNINISSMIITVRGSPSMNNTPFSQTFILSSQNGGGYLIEADRLSFK